MGCQETQAFKSLSSDLSHKLVDAQIQILHRNSPKVNEPALSEENAWFKLRWGKFSLSEHSDKSAQSVIQSSPNMDVDHKVKGGLKNIR